MDSERKKSILVLLSEENALFNNSIFCLRKNVDDTSVWGHKEDQLFKAQIKMGDPLGINTNQHNIYLVTVTVVF